MTIDTPQVTIQLEDHVLTTMSLSGDVIRIGRLPDNEVPLSHPLVSRRHAELRRDGASMLLTDIGSTSGTYVGEVRLLPNQPHPLANGDSFTIGPFLLTYRSAQTAEEVDSPDTLDRLHTPPDSQQPATPTRDTADVAQGNAPQPHAPTAQQDTHASLTNLASGGHEAARGGMSETLARGVAPRAQLPVLPPQGPWSQYLDHLPIVFHGNDFLGRFLLIFESVWEPLEQRQDHIDMYFDPRTSPATFLPWLADWLGISVNRQWPESRIRHLVDSAMELYQWRGTRYGLERMIEVCTGLHPTITNDSTRPFCIRVAMTVPLGSDIDRDVVEELLTTHKPAHVGYELIMTHEA